MDKIAASTGKHGRERTAHTVAEWLALTRSRASIVGAEKTEVDVRIMGRLRSSERLGRCVGLACGLSILALGTVARAREPVRLEPSAPWNLHYSESSCQLFRTFGSGDNKITMALERVSPDSGLSLILIGRPLVSRGGDRPAKAVFLPFTDNVIESANIGETVADKRTAIVWQNVTLSPTPPDYSAAARAATRRTPADSQALSEENRVAGQITALEITERGSRKTILTFKSLGTANEMMRQCAKEQLVRWGVDPLIEDKIVLRPMSKSPLSRLLSANDYPNDAVRKGAESIINARLLVDSRGDVSRCTTLTNFKEPGFAEVVCKRLTKAKFAPAETSDGSKVPSYVTTTIRFVMP